jgi:hypothetical protein
MKGLCPLLALLLALAPPAGASLPLPPPSHAYYGPLRVCAGLFAFDVEEGEGYVEDGNRHTLLSHRFALGIGESWIYADESFRDIVHPRGELELPGAGRLQRIDHSSRNAPGSRILYLWDSGERGPFPIKTINSDAFDGSERDRAILERLAFGERARAMCEAAPDPLRPRPQPENAIVDAQWLEPREYRGPLTVCMSGLAFDVAGGEAAVLPWSRHSTFFRILAGGRAAIVHLYPPGRLGAEPANAGALAANPDFELRDGPAAMGWWPGIGFERDGMHHVRLLRRAEMTAERPETTARATFLFDAAATETERNALIARLRVQRPDDRCFDSRA